MNFGVCIIKQSLLNAYQKKKKTHICLYLSELQRKKKTKYEVLKSKYEILK